MWGAGPGRIYSLRPFSCQNDYLRLNLIILLTLGREVVMVR